MLHRQLTDDERFDVIILGSGIAGTSLGAILARNGASVLLVDAATHPRFAVGESSTVDTMVMFKLLAARYGVPELEYLTSYESCLSEIGQSFGVKRHFGFLMHRPGEEPDPHEAHQLNTSVRPIYTSHLFRQDSDAYLLYAAIRYGCVVRQGYQVADIDLAADYVEISGHDGSRYRARYLVDASGFRSRLAKALSLREDPPRLKHHSRSMFTHMVHVRTTDECLRMPPADLPPVPWFQGTMHHIIPRGWFWIVPFNNEPRSRNPLVSVGLTLDERRYPRPDDVAPAEEFAHHASRYPVLGRIFQDARPVREWVATDRLQYSSRQTVGHRWCLMSHAAGFVDPLFSRGLSNTAEVINALAWRLLAALDDGDFAVDRFAYVERLEQGLLDFNDQIVNASYIGFDDYELWNAVFRVWGYGSLVGNWRVDRYLAGFKATGDRRALAALEQPENTGLWWPDSPGYRELLAETVRLCDAVDAGSLSAPTAGRTLLARIAAADFIAPGLGFREAGVRFIHPSEETLHETMRWLASDAPQDMRYLVADRHPNRATAVAHR